VVRKPFVYCEDVMRGWVAPPRTFELFSRYKSTNIWNLAPADKEQSNLFQKPDGLLEVFVLVHCHFWEQYLTMPHLKTSYSKEKNLMRRTLTELARNPDLISGIYNYCDRWCERCPLSSRCLLYASELEDDDGSPESRDIQNEAFWKKLSSIFQETQEMLKEWADDAGIDLNEFKDEDDLHLRRRRRHADNHALAKAGKKYANAASDWF